MKLGMKTLYEQNYDALVEKKPFSASFDEPLSLELAFTNFYQEHQQEHSALREAHCLDFLLPHLFQPIEEGDLFAGRVRYPLVAFSPEPAGLGYSCRAGDIRKAMDSLQITGEVEAMLAFWEKETTAAKCRAVYPPHIQKVLPSDNWTEESGIAFPLYRMAGATLDYGKLMRLGVPDLREKILARKNETSADAHPLFDAMILSLDTLCEIAEMYKRQAEAMARDCGDADQVAALKAIAEGLRFISHRAPENFREALQLFWLYALASGTWNYGRMDIYMGPFLASDLDNGMLTEAEALMMLQSLWRLMKAYDNQYNNRVFIGGKGRPNEDSADRFAMLAMEATRTVLVNQPQLSLRFYKGQNPALMEKALTVIGEGRTFPMLYNDDVNVPAVARAFRVSEEVAVHYTPFGCGEYVLSNRSVGSPNGVINLLKGLEVTLHNGIDPVTGKPCGLALGAPESFKTFDDVWNAYARQIEYHVEALAEQQKIEYDVTGRESPFLFISMLYDDCIARGKGVFDGGALYLGGTLETYGNNNTADALLAIRELVFEMKQLTLRQIVEACDAEFKGYEHIRAKLLAVPKFGNDNDVADAMAVKVHDHICHTTRNQADRVGLHSYLVVIINNWANALFGRTTIASPDGRAAWTAMANGNNPAPGMDRSGSTAFLNSLARLDPAIHAGAVQNMKFSKSMFTVYRPKLEALLAGYFKRGGAQSMITVVSRQDLESAMKEPEKWGHLMVRVGGFSSRFIDLPHDAQLEVLNRTLHE